MMDPEKRVPIITGNWKMYKTIEEAKDFVKELTLLTQNSLFKIFLAVPFTMIHPLTQEGEESKITIGAQNMNDASEGAFTGEVSAKMLKDAGAQFVILGHSERRRLFLEDDSFINRKLKRAILTGLQPVLCIGETKEEREEGKTEEVIRRQLSGCLADIEADSLKNLILAYEPVWAIGTGETSTPEEAQQVHHFCRDVLASLFTPEIANQIVIQYGGSVNSSNSNQLLDQPDIDGLLVGGASLSLESFSQIVNDRNIKL
jgi:triosephosphate isomerase